VTARWATVLAGLILGTIAACATPAASGGDGGWPTGRTFLSTSVIENAAPKMLVTGTRISLSFDVGGGISANAGCNTMGGTGRLRSGKLEVTDVATTLMGCRDELNRQDTWLLDFLTGNPAMTMAGNALTLTGNAITIELTDRTVPDPDRPLLGTRWVVDTIFHGDVASSVPQEAPATLVIDEAGGFQASTGCVGGSVKGTAVVGQGRVAFTPSGQTPCTTAGNDLDAVVRAMLTGERAYEITARRLRLLGPGGSGLGLLADA